jgi:hypothetical protein
MDGACGTHWAKKKKKHSIWSENLTGDGGKIYVNDRYIELEFKEIKYQGVG